MFAYIHVYLCKIHVYECKYHHFLCKYAIPVCAYLYVCVCVHACVREHMKDKGIYTLSLPTKKQMSAHK